MFDDSILSVPLLALVGLALLASACDEPWEPSTPQPRPPERPALHPPPPQTVWLPPPAPYAPLRGLALEESHGGRLAIGSQHVEWTYAAMPGSPSRDYVAGVLAEAAELLPPFAEARGLPLRDCRSNHAVQVSLVHRDVLNDGSRFEFARQLELAGLYDPWPERHGTSAITVAWPWEWYTDGIVAHELAHYVHDQSCWESVVDTEVLAKEFQSYFDDHRAASETVHEVVSPERVLVVVGPADVLPRPSRKAARRQARRERRAARRR